MHTKKYLKKKLRELDRLLQDFDQYKNSNLGLVHVLNESRIPAYDFFNLDLKRKDIRQQLKIRKEEKCTNTKRH